MEDKNMKKNYINPQMVVVKIQAQQMLALSDPKLGAAYESGETVLGRESDWDDED